MLEALLEVVERFLPLLLLEVLAARSAAALDLYFRANNFPDTYERTLYPPETFTIGIFFTLNYVQHG